MNRLDFFLAAMDSGMYRNKAWVVSAFAVIQEGPDAYKADPYPYRLVQQPTGTFYVNPDNTSEILPLVGAIPGQAPFTKAEKIDLKAGQVPNLTKDINTSYGNVFANYLLLVWPFGNKLPFVEGRFDPNKLESMILPVFVDSPETDEEKAKLLAKNPGLIFPEEWIKFADAMTFISGFANLWVPGGSRKMLMPPPGVKELREALFKKYEIDPANPNTDPAKVAMVAKELVAFDAKFLEGDDALNIIISKKGLDVVRAKKFLMIGAEAGLGDGQQVELIGNSLHEGWDVEKMPAMVNNLRAGSFNRGAETMKGGESVKWLLRASSNINILPTDCKTTMGVEVTLTAELKKKYLNFSIVGEPAVQLTEEVFPKYVGKTVQIRSPMYCKLDHTDYCAVCVGPRLAENPTGASSSISAFGSTIMLMFMKAVHGKALILKKYDYKARIF